MHLFPPTAAEKLGFEAIRREIGGLLATVSGTELLSAARPQADRAVVLEELQVVAELQAALRFDDPLYWRDVHLSIYDVQGRLVRDLGVTRQLELSSFNRSWSGIRADGRQAAPGVYFLKIEIGETVESHKLVLVR